MPATVDITLAQRELRPTARSAAGPWLVVALLVALPTLLPVLGVVLSLLQPADQVTAHVWSNVVPRVTANTLWLVLGVAAGATVVGTSLAWLTARYDFPGRRWLSWALILPLAMPAYVAAVAYIGLLDWSGPVQSALRSLWPQAPDLGFRSRWGVTLVMVLCLYPYVYLMVRAGLLSLGRTAEDVARTLGLGPVRTALRAQLPLVMPWILGGAVLVALETLADFGTVAAFNYDTYTVAIYQAWYSLYSLPAAQRLAALLLLVAALLFILDLHARGRRAFHRDRPDELPARTCLSGPAAWLATAAALLVLGLAFLLPVLRLATWGIAVWSTEVGPHYWGYLGDSLLLASLAGVTVVAAALLLSYGERRSDSASVRGLARLATAGYALPGPLLAVGVFTPLAALSSWSRAQGLDLALHSGLLALLIAYLARFLMVAHGPVERGFLRIPVTLDDASRVLGVGGTQLLRRVHLPLLRGGVLTGTALVLVDVMKEMPITLMLRPFGVETLAVRVFELTAEGELMRAAIPSLAIVAVGLLPVLLLVRGTEVAR